MNERLEKLNEEIARCQEAMWSKDLDLKYVELYEDYYKSLLQEKEYLINQNQSNKVEKWKIGTTIFGTLATIGICIYDHIWSKKMICFTTQWEEGNMQTKTAGKMLFKNIMPKK